MSEVKIKLHPKQIREFLRGHDIRSDVARRAHHLKKAASTIDPTGEYAANVIAGKKRSVARTTGKGDSDKTLLKALGAISE